MKKPGVYDVACTRLHLCTHDAYCIYQGAGKHLGELNIIIYRFDIAGIVLNDYIFSIGWQEIACRMPKESH